MLGIRCKHEPISGAYAKEMMDHIIEMTENPVVVDKSAIKFHFDWSDVDNAI